MPKGETQDLPTSVRSKAEAAKHAGLLSCRDAIVVMLYASSRNLRTHDRHSILCLIEAGQQTSSGLSLVLRARMLASPEIFRGSVIVGLASTAMIRNPELVLDCRPSPIPPGPSALFRPPDSTLGDDHRVEIIRPSTPHRTSSIGELTGEGELHAWLAMMYDQSAVSKDLLAKRISLAFAILESC